MCLAIPVKILKINKELAEVEISGLKKTISLQLLPEAKTGDYVIIHAGFAIQKLDEKEAKETLELIKQMYQQNS